ADVAEALGIDVPTLRWLAWHAEAVKTDHYVHFEVPKRSGGERTLSAPMPRLAAAQQWVLANVLVPLPTEEPAHGFVRGRSTVTNARPHVGRDIVVNLDLKDFFPTITFPRVRGVFRRLGYSPAAASVLALLCTACTRREVSLEGEVWRVAVGNRALPQGACTSPALSNQVARRLDRRLQGLCRKLGWAYTRYADDLTFSAPAGHQSEVGGLLRSVQRLVEDEGFALNPAKGRVQRRSGRQSVTGVSVNDQLGLPRKDLRQLRALLHNAKSTGLAAQNRAGVPDFEAHIMGRIGYLAMIDSEKARPFWDAFLAVRGS
ncbi:MAG: RNA-directed DNA polymerase, partial [Myxococcota bacterium]